MGGLLSKFGWTEIRKKNSNFLALKKLVVIFELEERERERGGCIVLEDFVREVRFTEKLSRYIPENDIEASWKEIRNNQPWTDELFQKLATLPWKGSTIQIHIPIYGGVIIVNKDEEGLFYEFYYILEIFHNPLRITISLLLEENDEDLNELQEFLQEKMRHRRNMNKDSIFLVNQQLVNNRLLLWDILFESFSDLSLTQIYLFFHCKLNEDSRYNSLLIMQNIHEAIERHTQRKEQRKQEEKQRKQTKEQRDLRINEWRENYRILQQEQEKDEIYMQEEEYRETELRKLEYEEKKLILEKYIQNVVLQLAHIKHELLQLKHIKQAQESSNFMETQKKQLVARIYAFQTQQIQQTMMLKSLQKQAIMNKLVFEKEEKRRHKELVAAREEREQSRKGIRQIFRDNLRIIKKAKDFPTVDV